MFGGESSPQTSQVLATYRGLGPQGLFVKTPEEFEKNIEKTSEKASNRKFQFPPNHEFGLDGSGGLPEFVPAERPVLTKQFTEEQLLDESQVQLSQPVERSSTPTPQTNLLDEDEPPSPRTRKVGKKVNT